MRKIIKAIFIQVFLSLVITYIVFLIFGSIVGAVIILFILLLLILIKPAFVILNVFIRRTNWYKKRVSDSDKFRKRINTSLEICNLGSNSGKYAFTYEGSGLKGENWALGPQTLSYDFRVLKNYHSYLKEGATVLIPLCPFSSCIKDFEDDSVNHKYYSFLHPILILNFSQMTKEQVLRFVKTPFLVEPIKSMIRVFRDIVPVDKAKMTKESLEIDANKFINNWKDQFSISNLDAPVSELNKESITYNTILLTDMISFCLERKLKPVIVIPPISTALTSKLSETFRENYIHSFINKGNSKQIPFMNYMDDERFIAEDLYFNSYFLNRNGRKLFTMRLLMDLSLVEKN